VLGLFALLSLGAVIVMGSRKAWGYVGGKGTLITLSPIGLGQSLREDAAESFHRMAADAADVGIELRPTSGFRWMGEQMELWSRYLAGEGNLAARPGYSEHQSGTAVDIEVGSSFESGTYRWLSANAHRYGWVNTGKAFSQPEPWHWSWRP
jgi:LAS superfamily LD-carboxypeptidase LdcB